MILINLLVLLTFSNSSYGAKYLPVFILDYDQTLTNLITNNNPFYKTSRGEFTDIVHDVIRKSDTVIIFTETLFCSEDVSSRDKDGTSYPNMRKALHEQKVKYLPAVEEPYSILIQIFQPDPQNIFKLSVCNARAKLTLDPGHTKYFYVYFQDQPTDPRTESLRCHDAVMKEVYLQTRMSKPAGKIVAFYTGMTSPIIAERRLLKPVKTQKEVESVPTVFLSSDGALFRFKGVYFTRGRTVTSLFEMPSIAEETWTKRKLTTKMSYTDFEMQFEFSFRSDGWSLDSVSLLESKEVVGTLRLTAGAPWGNSYVCSDPLIISGGDGFVSINHYQIQPFRYTRKNLVVPYGDKNIALAEGTEDDDGPEPIPDVDAPGRNSTCRFGKSVHCGPYFSISILSCLFVSALLLGVLTGGIVMLMNCKTNDHYDDPHGKPLQFTSEF